jgi:hypothetical protein
MEEIGEHFAEMFLAISKGIVEGIAIAIVTKDGDGGSILTGNLSRNGGVALVLRDATMHLTNECEYDVQEQLIAPILKAKKTDLSGGRKAHAQNSVEGS